ncbi:hypothetical protein [Rhodopila globiformis]|uniref:hypothetical protein n=1 Tax=Rhodopila globiformis TaxID=1071 RepID=UPI0011AFEA1E|nr:hypothetical protein [Rhodopila globiformis]
MKTVLTESDRELIQQLFDDVGVLEDQFLVGLPKPAATRAVFVPILRRWIVEQLFHRVQRLVRPLIINFPISSNSHAIEACKVGSYDHWMGLVTIGPAGFTTGLVTERLRGTPQDPTPWLVGPHCKPLPQNARTFFNQKIFYWKGQFYTRMDVIKMHANALGGVHFGFDKIKSETHIVEIKNYLGLEINGSNRVMIEGETISRGRADPSRRQNIYDATELVAIDTARIFAVGIRASAQPLLQLLATGPFDAGEAVRSAGAEDDPLYRTFCGRLSD